MPTFDYNLNIPNGPNNPSADQPLMQTNTNSIDSIIGVDHYTFESASGNDGFHQKVTLPSASIPTSAAGQVVLFGGTLPSGTSAVFYSHDNSGTGPFNITNIDPVVSPNGYSSLIGNMLIQWGQVNNPGTSGNVVFPQAFLAANPPFTIQLTLQRSSAGQIATVDNTSPPTNVGFSYLTSSTGSNVLYWLVIGTL